MLSKISGQRFPSIFFLLIYLYLFINPSQSYCQQDSDSTQTEKRKPRIIFKNQQNESLNVLPSDSTKANIIFKKSYYLKQGKINLLNEDKFQLYDEEKFVGDEGEFLIEAFGSNQRAIDQVNEAYRIKDQGNLFMILAGVGVIIGLATIPMVKIGESNSGHYTTTYYWLPPVTIGTILGGIGYAKYTSLESNLDKAVKMYNDDLSDQE